MEQEERDRMGRELENELRNRWPDVTLERVAVMQYGDDPKIEPGELLVRVYIEASGDEEDRRRALDAFHGTHREAIHELRHELNNHPGVGALEITVAGREGQPNPVIRLGGRPRGGIPESGDGPLVPVMARLGPADLETVDTLITAGIAASRADAVRWALARIRERPAYEKLRQRAREIEELKAQF
jgi:hypothetical protein